MASKVDRIAQLLASGLAPTMIANITACSPSYVSQLMADPDFKLHVQELKEEMVNEESSESQEITTYTDKLLGAEHKIVNHILERLPMMEDRTVISALREIGARNDSLRKTSLINNAVKEVGQKGGTLRMIEISIPSVAAPDITFGKNNEIVQIGSRSIAPMPTAALQKIIDGDSLNAIEGSYENEQDFIAQAIDGL